MKKVLLTGAAGFIGYHTALRLFSEGFEVVGVDNLNDYYDVSLKLWRLEELKKRENFAFYKLDIENYRELEKIFAENEFESVINLAARAGVPYSKKNPFVYLSTNSLGVLNILELMVKHSVPKLVQASTSSLYAGEKTPFKETLPVNSPISVYAASKKAAEMLAYTYRHLYGLDVSVLRYFTVFGPAGRPDMSVFRFIKRIDEEIPVEVFGDGSQTRDFTYAEDIAEGTVLARKKLGYEIINLGGGRVPVSILEVINKIGELLGKKPKIIFKDFLDTDMRETSADIAKAKELLNWKPKRDFWEGLELTVKWHKENRSLLRNVKL